MKKNTLLWIAGLVGVAAVGGTVIYVVTKPKTGTTTDLSGRGTGPAKPAGGGTPTTFVTPTASPGIFAAVAPGINVSWVDQNGKPIGQGGGGGVDTSTARVPR
jgi:hypothetical protein